MLISPFLLHQKSNPKVKFPMLYVNEPSYSVTPCAKFQKLRKILSFGLQIAGNTEKILRLLSSKCMQAPTQDSHLSLRARGLWVEDWNSWKTDHLSRFYVSLDYSLALPLCPWYHSLFKFSHRLTYLQKAHNLGSRKQLLIPCFRFDFMISNILPWP